jgi:hypothetical protein
MEASELPLQVALLTMEVASLRERLVMLARVFDMAAEAASPPIFDPGVPHDD